MRIFLIPTFGLIITMIAGIGKTENLSLMRTPSAQNIEYNTYQSTGFILNAAADVGSSGIQLDLPDCDGEDCGVLLLVIALIVLTFILIVGSALIPHFWLFSGSLLLCIMLLIATHDLLVRRTIPAKRYFPG